MPGNRHLVYFADPMCSWCWGFAPVLDELVDKHAGAVNLDMVHGGLRPGPKAREVDQEMKSYLQHHWENVKEQSGQPFNWAFFDRTEFLYDTGPATMAALTVRAINPALEHPFCSRLQRAFYAENINITDQQEIVKIVAEFSIDPNSFIERYESDWSQSAMMKEFDKRRALGVRSFPTLLLRFDSDTSPVPVSVGYQPLEAVEQSLSSLLKSVG